MTLACCCPPPPRQECGKAVTRKPGGHDRKQLLCQPRAPTAARGRFLLVVHNSHSHFLENYFTKLSRGVVLKLVSEEQPLTNTASPCHFPEKGQSVPMTQGGMTSLTQGGMTQGCRSCQHWRSFSPQSKEGQLGAEWKRARGKVAGFAAAGSQVDSTLHMHSRTEPADLLQPRTGSCILTSSCHRPSTSSHPLSPVWLQPPDPAPAPHRKGSATCPGTRDQHMATVTAQRGLGHLQNTGRAQTHRGCSQKPVQSMPPSLQFPNSFQLIPLPTTVPSPGRKGCSTWEQDKPQP